MLQAVLFACFYLCFCFTSKYATYRSLTNKRSSCGFRESIQRACQWFPPLSISTNIRISITIMSLEGQGQVIKFKWTQICVRSSISIQIQKHVVWKKASAGGLCCRTLCRNQELMICRWQAQFLSSLSQCSYRTDWRTAGLTGFKTKVAAWNTARLIVSGRLLLWEMLYLLPKYGIFPTNYTGCFTTCGHYCRRWFPRHLWLKKFI